MKSSKGRKKLARKEKIEHRQNWNFAWGSFKGSALEKQSVCVCGGEKSLKSRPPIRADHNAQPRFNIYQA